MEVLLGVEVEVIMLFALIEELLLHSVLAAGQVLLHLELLRTQLVHQLDIPLEEVFRHKLYVIFIPSLYHRPISCNQDPIRWAIKGLNL